MKASTQLQPEQQRGRPAAAPDGKARQSNDAGFVDNRAEAGAQRQLSDAIGGSARQAVQSKAIEAVNNSPRVAAQRVQLGGMVGAPAQLQAGPEEDELQMKAASDVLQRRGLEEEELLQGKFDVAQKVEEDEQLQGKFEAVQRVEDEEPLQGKFETVQRVEEEELLQGRFVPVQLKQGSAPQANNTGLPDNLKAGVENLSGMSMDHVKVHYNSAQPAQLNALAYAQGADIHVASGQEQHLPHEAWHVVQQAQGRVKPTRQMKDGVPVNDDHGLEHEADVMGAKALQMRGADQVTTGPIADATTLEAGQREPTEASGVPGAAIRASGPKGRSLNFRLLGEICG